MSQGPPEPARPAARCWPTSAALISALDILGEGGVAQRATFLVDPDGGGIRFIYVTDGSVDCDPPSTNAMTSYSGEV